MPFLLSPVGIQKNIKFEKRGLSLLLHICLHQIHNNGIVICRLNIEYGFCFTSAAVRICVFEKLFFLEVSSSEATKSYSNYFKRLQKRKCVLLYLEIFFFRRVVFCQKKNPSSPRKSSFFRKCPSTYLTTLKWKKKNWVSFNKNLELHFVKKNPTFSNREIQCEKSDTCHCHTLYYYNFFFLLKYIYSKCFRKNFEYFTGCARKKLKAFEQKSQTKETKK